MEENPEKRQSLFVILGYKGDRADNPAEESNFLQRLESNETRQHRRAHRDFYANPRDLEYQLNLVADFRKNVDQSIGHTIVLDNQFLPSVIKAIKIHNLEINEAYILDLNHWHVDLLGQADKYGKIVLVYADALGLGCERIEKLALWKNKNVYVLNGRRRYFKLNFSMVRRVQISRILAKTRIVEKVFAIIICTLAYFLLALDLIFLRNDRQR